MALALAVLALVFAVGDLLGERRAMALEQRAGGGYGALQGFFPPQAPGLVIQAVR